MSSEHAEVVHFQSSCRAWPKVDEAWGGFPRGQSESQTYHANIELILIIETCPKTELVIKIAHANCRYARRAIDPVVSLFLIQHCFDRCLQNLKAIARFTVA